MAGPSFANLADAGRQLGSRLLGEGVDSGELVLAVIPNGVPVAKEAARVAGLELAAVRISRTPAGERVVHLPHVAGRTVVLIDDGVETGSVARCVGERLRLAGARESVLAVPVCPVEAMEDLLVLYDRVVALVESGRDQDLASHFEEFDTIDDAAADRLLA
jgi:putative phosphoribosyl transferase